MTSADSVRKWARVRDLREAGQRRAALAWRRKVVECDALQRSLDETRQALLCIEREREALFDRHRGVLSRGGLFALRRRDSALETKRIHLSLDQSEQASRLADAERAVDQAHAVLMRAQHRHEKFVQILQRFSRDVEVCRQRREENDIEEHQYVR